MNHRLFFTCLGFTASLLTSTVQGQPLPHMPKWETIHSLSQDSLQQLEPQIIIAAHWLESTALNQQQAIRNNMIESVLAWTSKTNKMTFSVRKAILDIFYQEYDLVGVYTAAYVRWSLQHHYGGSELERTVAGIKAVIKCYQLGGGKDIEQLTTMAKMNDKVLKGYIQTLISTR